MRALLRQDTNIVCLQRRWHVGLIGFFVVAALTGAATGVLVHRFGGDARLALGTSALTTALVAFSGVFHHRLTVLRLKQAEVEDYLARIERAHEKLRAVLDGSTDLVLVLDGAGRIVESSALARELLRLDEAHDWRARVRAEDRPRLEAALARATAGERVALDGILVELAGGEPGATLACDLRAAGLEAGGERLLFVALRDVSAQERMERELKLRERLSALGLLTTGVAHEINNPLEGIGNYLSLLARADVDSQSRDRWLGEVRHGFEQIRNLVRNLLLFARPNQTCAPVDLGRTVNRALAATRSTRRMNGVEIERAGLEPSIFVAGEAARLEQVLINLLLNAGAALAGGGLVRVSAAREQAGGGRAASVRVVVEDDGPGIAPEVRDRVFDPFFTTGEGTGMGLAVSYGIVQAHGGSITIDDSPLGGARFTLHLPAAEPEFASPPADAPAFADSDLDLEPRPDPH